MTDKKKRDDPSLAGLGDFAKDFLFKEGGEEVAMINGQENRDDQLKKWVEFRTKEFIERAGSLCEDTMAYFNDAKHGRGYDNQEAVFALALLTINFRHSWGFDPRSDKEQEKGVAPDVSEERLREFDKICFYAQKYFEANKDKP